jgi:2TM domain
MISHDRLTHINSDAPAHTSSEGPSDSEQLAREQAIKRIERKRRYWISTAVSTVGMLVLAAIWVITEYHNAGGWPTQGFSQSSGIHDVWNIWIIYPAIAWAFLTTAFGLGVYLRKPISESQIKREMERQAHSH